MPMSHARAVGGTHWLDRKSSTLSVAVWPCILCSHRSTDRQMLHQPAISHAHLVLGMLPPCYHSWLMAVLGFRLLRFDLTAADRPGPYHQLTAGASVQQRGRHNVLALPAQHR